MIGIEAGDGLEGGLALTPEGQVQAAWWQEPSTGRLHK